MVSTDTQQETRVYGYRWVVLLAFVFGGFMLQVFWICYAPITKVAMLLFCVALALPVRRMLMKSIGSKNLYVLR